MTTLDAVTFGEVMGMFVATSPGPLHRVRGYELAQAGATGYEKGGCDEVDKAGHRRRGGVPRMAIPGRVQMVHVRRRCANAR